MQAAAADRESYGQRILRTENPTDRESCGQRILRTENPTDREPYGQRTLRTENPTDRGARWTTVHRVANSWTQLRRLSAAEHTRRLERGENKNYTHRRINIFKTK